MSRQALEECVTRLENSYKTNKGIVEAEARAIEKLSSKKDILEFRKIYIEILKNNLLEKYDPASEKKEGFSKLIDKNYDINLIAALRFNDSMLFTLGHMYNKNVNNWYNALPYVSRSSIPKQNEMYRTMSPEIYGKNPE